MEKIIRYQSGEALLCGIVQEVEHPAAAVLMLHGINSDKDEDGFFTKIAGRFATAGCNVLRFDFRGHGKSSFDGLVTIAGELEDTVCSIEYVNERWNLPVILLAASFGTVSLLESFQEHLWRNVRGMILLNPVLDLQKTFLESKLPWPQKSFHAAAYRELEEQGYFLLDGRLKIGKELMEELRTKTPYRMLKRIGVPILMVHGDADQYVPYEVTKEHAATCKNCEFVTIPEANHGFGRPSEQAQVFDCIDNWTRQLGKQK